MDSATPRLRILHLEDEPNDRELVAAALVRAGLAADIVTVDTREAFVRALGSVRFDVILADDRLPSFDGETAQQLALQLAPGVPLIFVSGTLGEEVAVERLKAGATDYVLKQRLARLPTSITRAIGEARARIERLAAEAEVRRLNSELEARVAARTEELARANRALGERQVALTAARLEAERANRAKSEFLSRMSHDLRTPLNAVLGFAQLLETDRLSDEQHDCVQQILRGGQHLLALINEVLDIAQIEAGRLSLSLEPVALSETIRHALALVAPLAGRGDVTLAFNEAIGDPHAVVADRQRLNQILLNLLSNAVKYNRSGGKVIVSIESVAGARVRINVTDTGAGIPQTKLQLLFTPFERLGAESTSIEGTGLGLALSRGLAEAMGGSVGVVSEVDRGSTFWVELGASEHEPELADGMVGSDMAIKATPRPATVLYIEDNSSNAKLMERILRRRPGVTLLQAGQGQLGVTLAAERKPDVIFLDLHLPDIAGEEVLRQLWMNPELRRIPVIVLSADATPGQIRRLLASGAWAYLTKPLDLHRVLTTLDHMLLSPSPLGKSAFETPPA